MSKEDVVKLMSDIVEKENIKMAQHNNISSDMIDEYVNQSRPMLEYLNEKVYDGLLNVGIINNV
jgi:hypothetical protein